MKIAILSMQRVINYGSVLQAYSLKKIIEDITGESVRFIDIDSTEKIPVSGTITTYQDYSEKGLSIRNAPWLIFRKLSHRSKKNKYVQMIKDFQQNELDLNKKYNHENYDLVVVGSDEVFIAAKYICLQLYGKIDNAQNVITYAAASGMAQVENISKIDIETVRNALSNYKYMSVRDEHTKNYISELYNGDIQMHIDPVLAGELRKRNHKTVNRKPYLIVYAYAERIQDPVEVQAIKQYAKKKGLEIVCLGGQQLWADKFVPLSPFNMLDYFYNAECVVTDTFHGTVFSIINHCRFAVLKRKSNRFKIDGVLKIFGLSEHLIADIGNLQDILEKEIDYNFVDSILEREGKRTREYLKQCINSFR